MDSFWKFNIVDLEKKRGEGGRRGKIQQKVYYSFFSLLRLMNIMWQIRWLNQVNLYQIKVSSLSIISIYF